MKPEQLEALRGPVRFSNLKAMGTSAAHYLERVTGPGTRGRALTVGTLTHSIVLGGPEPIVYPGKVRNGKAWDAFKAECAELHPDSPIVLQSEYDAARRSADAVFNHRDAMSVLAGRHEVELPTWTYAGRRCGGRVDVIADSHVSELKTSVTAEPWRFGRMAIRMAYHAQLDWYLYGNRSNGGTAKDAFVVVVESTRPHPVTVMPVTPRCLEAGRKLWVMWMERLLACESANEWPPYAQNRVELDLPEEEQDGPELDFPFDASEEAA